MTDKEILQRTLDALNRVMSHGLAVQDAKNILIAALEKLLAQPDQKPVAWVTGWHDGHCVIRAANPSAILPIGIALYTAPPRRKWVGLTEEEIDALPLPPSGTATVRDLVRIIEAAHGIKE